MALSSGERVGRYVLGAHIADGPRGSVHRATQDVSGRIVALKVLRPEGSSDVTRLVASARSGAALDHPNIAAVVEVGTHDACLFVARELVQGASLSVRAKGAPLADRLRWLIAAAGALHAAHRRGVVHGAVRDGNVLIEDDGTLKLTDFAIGAAAEAADDRRGWIELAHAIVETPEITASIRDALQAAEGDDGSLDRAASILETALDEPIDVRDLTDTPDAIEAPNAPPIDAIEAFVPAGTLRTQSRDPSQVPRFVLVALIITCSLVVLYATRRRATPRPIETSEAGAAVAPNASQGAQSRSPQAVALFNGAMQSMRDASTDLARAALNEALRLDPSFAAAHLRRALVSVVIDDASREHFSRATSLRNALSPHERVLLDGFEPVMRGSPAFALSVARMEAAVARSPDDADFAFHLGVARWLAGDFRGAISEMDRVLALDGHMAVASRARGYLLSLLGQAPQALAEYEHCLTLSPAATSCLFNLADLQAYDGDCHGSEDTARRMIAISPSSPNGYWFLARALAAEHQDEAASVALAEHVRRLPAESRSAQEASFDTRRAVLRGDFVSAERALRAWDSAIADVTDEWQHATVAETKMEVALETGRAGEAREAGSAFLARQSALTGRPIHSDVRLIILGAMHRADGISSAPLDALRDDARRALPDGGTSWRATAQAEEGWILAYATSVASPAEARDALAMLPKYPALPPEILRDPVEVDGMLGRMFFLAGQPDEAIAKLSRAARSCLALDAPLFQTQLTKLLADAEAARGETTKACADYAEVIRRWGVSTLPSNTARSAKAGFATLGCGRD